MMMPGLLAFLFRRGISLMPFSKKGAFQGWGRRETADFADACLPIRGDFAARFLLSSRAH